MRGTVQLGATRNIFLKGLKKSTKLVCGKDYSLSYMPERLVEGDALAEMETIPTLVSGFSQSCLNNALNFTKSYFNNYLPVESFEEAEIIKLASNTYRDFKFAFANEISRIANLNNLSGAELIEKLILGTQGTIFLNRVLVLVVFVCQKIHIYLVKVLATRGTLI